VCDPLTRKNTLTNTPAIIHYEIISEDIFEIYLMPKGCGSENMSALCMLSPSVGIEGIKKFVIEIVKKAGPNPCPPIIVGVGIGGNFEKVALLAKRALFRLLGESNPDPEIAKLEKELLEEINSLGIGPLGFGGKITCLGVHIETYPCHIASLPVAVNIQCHSARLARIKLI
ncbi:MAG: fumarate hydratase, partial [Thermodesulfobacterium geofontis]